jgi:hypothetical protein
MARRRTGMINELGEVGVARTLSSSLAPAMNGTPRQAAASIQPALPG